MHRTATTPRPSDPTRAAAHLRLAIVITQAETACALQALQDTIAHDWSLTRQRLAASTLVHTEAHALHGAAAALEFGSVPHAIAALQGWTENPRSN